MRIELQNLRKRFGRVEALCGVTATLAAGQRVALIGPNGSGKSTLIRAVLGLIECEGEVLLDGRSPFDDRLAVAKRLGYVPQTPPQLSAPVSELVRTICLTRDLASARVFDFAARFQLDLEAISRRPFRNLSGGMKQKLLIALAFAGGPSLLVLDEPTASLDARARDCFFDLVSGLSPETTVLLCSHRLEELERLATHVWALEEGRLAWQGETGSRASDSSGKRVVEVLLEAAEPREVIDARA